MSITYDYYRIFYYVAKYQNFTQAATALMNNQPNVSRAISNLEHELGCRLFIRSNRGVTLTPEGQKLYRRISVAHRQIEMAQQELSDAKNLQNGLVSIGVSETALHTFLLPRLEQFHQLYPDIHIKISSVLTAQAIASLKAGLVDFAVVTTPTGITRPLIEIPLMPLREILVGGTRFAHLARQPLKLSKLSGYPLILLNSQANTRAFYNRIFLEHGLSLVPEIEASVTDQVLPMIEHNLGIGFLPESLAANGLKEGRLFEIKLDCQIEQRTVCLVKDPGYCGSIAARALEKILRA
ncbi:MAG: LysR family transcriptional regulator [Lachnospiraceae bacterium]|nr:LysR family transcriptional regulator [Lachnospiraceae bacterium]